MFNIQGEGDKFTSQSWQTAHCLYNVIKADTVEGMILCLTISIIQSARINLIAHALVLWLAYIKQKNNLGMEAENNPTFQ